MGFIVAYFIATRLLASPIEFYSSAISIQIETFLRCVNRVSSVLSSRTWLANTHFG
jgi:hypothetical protein